MSRTTIDMRRLTVPEAEADKVSTLFVLNKSNPKGNVNFNVTDISGTRVGIRVPVTWIPVDLTNYAQKADILRNPDFRRLCAKGVLHIVDGKDANAVLREPKAQVESNRIYDIDVELSPQENVPSIDKQVNVAPPSEIKNPFIQNIVLRSTSENHEDLIVELDSKLDTLTIKDVEDLMANTPKSEIKVWAGEALLAIKN